MIDGVYQSLICFFMTFLLFHEGGFASSSGRDLNSRELMGVYVGCAAIVVVNSYVLINQYRWDWLFLLVTSISVLLIWFWTGVFSQATNTGPFYKAADHVYGALSFWVTTLLTVLVCLLPRMASKVVQKLFFPRDIDIIREQVSEGRFRYLYESESQAGPASPASTVSSDLLKPSVQPYAQDDDRRPIYPPSVAPTATTAGNRRSGNGSDGTDGSGLGTGTFTPRRHSMDKHRQSIDRTRASIDRMRPSMERTRASFEATSEFTSAAMLARMESRRSVQLARRPSLYVDDGATGR